MKNQCIITLLCLSLIGTIATAQTKKPTTTKKPSTTVKSTAPKTTTKTSTTTTTTMPNSSTAPVVVEEKKTTTTTTTIPTQTNSSSDNVNGTSSSTTIQQSSGPSKGGKKPTEPKPERVREPRPERVREPRPEKVRNTNSSSGEGVKFGIRAEATQLFTLESGGSFDLSPGVNAGLIVNIPVSPVVSIQPEVLYSMAVIKTSVDANNYGTGTVGSILAPLMININLGQGSTKFMLNLGGYANYKLSENSKLVIGGVTQQDGSVDLTNEDKFDYGAAIGLGVKINGNFVIEARSFYGLKDNTGKVGIGTIGIGYFF